MKKITVACATDDGEQFIDRHFGDANFYDIYTIDENETLFLKRIDNSTEEEEGHADPKKAKGISSLLMQEGVTIAVSRIFGPNIKRISKKFLCILVSSGNISHACNYIQNNDQSIADEFKKEIKIMKLPALG